MYVERSSLTFMHKIIIDGLRCFYKFGGYNTNRTRAALPDAV